MKKKIRNLIFDLGGVILDIDYDQSKNAFIRLGFQNFDHIYNRFKQDALFDHFEKGTITAQNFILQIQALSERNIKDSEIIQAWNAMLLDIPKQNLELLKNARINHRLFLLSNTNEIHYRAFFRYVQDHIGEERFRNYFEKDYYSHFLGLRKPNPEIFQYILKENNLIPGETLFIDDSPQHLAGAKKAGLHTFHKTNNQRWVDMIDIFNLDIPVNY